MDAAKRAVDGGVDVEGARGTEAGGHNLATLPTFARVPLVVGAVAPALVLASGGIADGRGLAAALMPGADGAWIGTRLVATDESLAHDSSLVPMRGATTVDLEEMPLLAGQAVGLVDAVKGAASVVADITATAVEMLRRYR